MHNHDALESGFEMVINIDVSYFNFAFAILGPQFHIQQMALQFSLSYALYTVLYSWNKTVFTC